MIIRQMNAKVGNVETRSKRTNRAMNALLLPRPFESGAAFLLYWSMTCNVGSMSVEVYPKLMTVPENLM